MLCFLLIIMTDFAVLFFFFFNDTATTEIYTLSYTTLFRSTPVSTEEKLPWKCRRLVIGTGTGALPVMQEVKREAKDRKSTRLNSSHSQISYAVFCLKKKKKRPHKGVI